MRDGEQERRKQERPEERELAFEPGKEGLVRDSRETAQSIGPLHKGDLTPMIRR